jgi:hypothetical protein
MCAHLFYMNSCLRLMVIIMFYLYSFQRTFKTRCKLIYKTQMICNLCVRIYATLNLYIIVICNNYM